MGRGVLDIDEEAFRKDELKIRLYGFMKVPRERFLVQSGKMVSVDYEEDNKKAIAKYFKELVEKDVLYLLSTGTTIKALAEELGIEKTLLGIDAYYNGKLVGRDLNERDILKLLREFRDLKLKLVLTPIGGQGFILGRGNQQLTPEVVGRIGMENIIIVATKSKMRGLRGLKVDVGDPKLDEAFRNRYFRVIVDYNEELVVKIS